MKVRIPLWGLVGGIVVLVGVILVVTFGGREGAPRQVSAPQNVGSGSVSQGEVVEVSMTARQFAFEPAVVRVKQGQTVRLKVKSVDVAHGIAIPDFGINEVLEPNKEVVIEFRADKKGSFPFLCSVFCGAGHSQMRGQIVVE